MTKKETIKVLQSIEDRAVDFPYMTACDWVAIAAAKRHLENSIDTKKVDLEKENLIGTFERKVKIDAGGYPYIDCSIEFYDYDKDIPLAKEGDKVKIIVVKGE